MVKRNHKRNKDIIHIKLNWKVFLAVIILIGIIIWGFHQENVINSFQNNNQKTNYQNNTYVPKYTPQQSCQIDGNTWCNGQCYSAKCPIGEQLLCLPYGGQPICITPQQPLSYSFESSIDQAPYYGAYCDKIDPYDLSVRQAEAQAIKNDSGYYSINQLFDIYDWVKSNIEYQTVPLAGIPYPPNQTLLTGTGDCKNQAVLIASMIEAVGGTAQVVADPSCEHAYAIVDFGSISNLTNFDQAVQSHYGSGTTVNYLNLSGNIWVIFDPAGGYYPGDTLSQCEVNGTTKYLIDSCMACAEEFPNTPYTYGSNCYAQCPSGTISVNNNACSPCPSGEYSYNNQCVSCPGGTVLGSDGECHQTCGGSNNYCSNGAYCYNGQCVSCSSGYILGSDGQCHQPCGSPTTYCSSTAYCYNNQCVTCPSGTVLHTDGNCYSS